MNITQLRALKNVLEQNGTVCVDEQEKTLLALGYAHFDLATAWQLLREAVITQESVLPLDGMVLWRLYQQSREKQHDKAYLQELYPTIIKRHRIWYDQYDYDEEGLPAQEGIQDPVFLTALTWSNERLIQIGHLLGEDVLEVIQWHELTIFSMNEKLWNDASGGYHAYELAKQKSYQTDGLSRFLPMAGEIPTQDQAECILVQLERVLFEHNINTWEAWMLHQGLLRYDFVDMAARLRQFIMESVSHFGCYDIYHPKTGEPILGEHKEQSPVAAALLMDLFGKRPIF